MHSFFARVEGTRTRGVVAIAIAFSGVASATVHASSPAAAAPPPATWTPPTTTRIDPTIFAELEDDEPGFRWSLRSTSPYARALRRELGVPVVVRFNRSPSPARLRALEAGGVHFTRRAPTLSGAWLARVTAIGARTLDGATDVVRASACALAHLPRPDDATALDEVRVTAAQTALRAADGTTIDGKGIVIADLDTSIFVFHPAFFRPDAGLRSFVDVDGDGKLTPAVDGIDLDGDGVISPAEVLQRLPQSLYNRETGRTTTRSDFALDREYLYLDENGNGVRDYGAKFSEDTRTGPRDGYGLHTLVEHVCVVRHTFPQTPQLFGSAVVLTQTSLHSVSPVEQLV